MLFILLVVFVIGFWLFPDIQRSKKEIVTRHIHERSMSFAMEQQKENCRIQYCQEMDKKDCLENPEYIECVERAKKRGKRIKK